MHWILSCCPPENKHIQIQSSAGPHPHYFSTLLTFVFSDKMVKPTVKSINNRSTEMEIKTLKLSHDMKSQLRSPMVWEKPASSMYNYHYEISGLYYQVSKSSYIQPESHIIYVLLFQPMIKYCIAREEGMNRAKVDMPDRLQSNYDKRS